MTPTHEQIAAIEAEARLTYPDLGRSTGAYVRRKAWVAGVIRGLQMAAEPKEETRLERMSRTDGFFRGLSQDAEITDKYPNQINKGVDNSF